jgi:hypothetical protein
MKQTVSFEETLDMQVKHGEDTYPEGMLEGNQQSDLGTFECKGASWLDRARSKGHRLAAGVLTTAAVFGSAETVQAQAIESPEKKALEQRYENYTQRFPGAIYVMSFADYYSPDNAEYACSRPQVILGNATYGYANKSKDSASVVLERKNSFYASNVALISDPTPGPHTPGDQVWEKFAVSCSDLVSIDVKFEMRYLAESIKNGRKIREWRKLPKTKSAIAEQWQPSAVRNEATDDVLINQLSVHTDNLAVNIPKRTKANTVYPTIVIRSESKIEKYTTETAVMLGRLQSTKRTVNAGSKYHGRGGSHAVTSKTIE